MPCWGARTHALPLPASAALPASSPPSASWLGLARPPVPRCFFGVPRWQDSQKGVVTHTQCRARAAAAGRLQGAVAVLPSLTTALRLACPATNCDAHPAPHAAQMQAAGIEPNAYIISSLINACERGGRLKEAIALFKRMQEIEGLPMGSATMVARKVRRQPWPGCEPRSAPSSLHRTLQAVLPCAPSPRPSPPTIPAAGAVCLPAAGGAHASASDPGGQGHRGPGQGRPAAAVQPKLSIRGRRRRRCSERG